MLRKRQDGKMDESEAWSTMYTDLLSNESVLYISESDLTARQKEKEEVKKEINQ